MPQSLLQGLPYGLKQSRIRGLDIPKISTKKFRQINSFHFHKEKMKISTTMTSQNLPG